MLRALWVVLILNPITVKQQHIPHTHGSSLGSKGDKALTSNRRRMAGAFAPRHENHIALAGVGIVVFDEEELVDAVILERRDLDHGTDGAGETSFDNEVLLTANL